MLIILLVHTVFSPEKQKANRIAISCGAQAFWERVNSWSTVCSGTDVIHLSVCSACERVFEPMSVNFWPHQPINVALCEAAKGAS